ncbi:MAG: hypothetical protein ACHQK9_20145 [Reyranellales bacterium]
MPPNDSINLCREQRVDVFGADGKRRLIVDHPLNSPLVGIPDQAVMVRASDFTAQSGDTTVAIYAARAGGSSRIATAETKTCDLGSLRLTGWRIEPGFVHNPASLEGRTVHRVVKSA